MKAIFNRLIVVINCQIGRLLAFFRCPLTERYIQKLIEKQGITIIHHCETQEGNGYAD